MSQNTLVLPTTGTVSGLQQTANMNAALDTLSTLEAGPAAPSNAQAAQLWTDTTNNLVKQYSGTAWQPVWSSVTGLPSNGPRGFLGGLTITQPTTNTIGISIGMASSESTVSGLMWNTAAFTKICQRRLGAGLRQRVTRYRQRYQQHLVSCPPDRPAGLLRRRYPDFAERQPRPTMPTGWTMRRRIGSIYMGASVLVTATQLGDYFYWISAPARRGDDGARHDGDIVCAKRAAGTENHRLAERLGAVRQRGGGAGDRPERDRYRARLYHGWRGSAAPTRGTAQATTFSLQIPTNSTQQVRARSSVALDHPQHQHAGLDRFPGAIHMSIFYVERDEQGAIVGIYPNPQPGFAEEELHEDHPSFASSGPRLGGACGRRANRALALSDWTQLADTPLAEEARAAWANYRHLLRLLPDVIKSPAEFEWPVPPDRDVAG